MTEPRQSKLLLILPASFNRNPSVLASFCRSDPAKSTRLNRDSRIWLMPSERIMDWIVNVKTVCDRLDSRFMAVALV